MASPLIVAATMASWAPPLDVLGVSSDDTGGICLFTRVLGAMATFASSAKRPPIVLRFFVWPLEPSAGSGPENVLYQVFLFRYTAI